VLGLVGNPALPAIAAEVKAKLERVVEKAAKGG